MTVALSNVSVSATNISNNSEGVISTLNSDLPSVTPAPSIPYTSYDFYRTNLSEIYNYRAVEEVLVADEIMDEELQNNEEFIEIYEDLEDLTFDEDLPLPKVIFGSNSIQSTDIVKVTGILPTIKALSTGNALDSLVQEVADEINTIYNVNLEMAKDAKASSIDFSYQIKVSGDVYHILITSITNSTRPLETIDIISFSAEAEELILINDILGPNAITILNEYINDIASKDPKTYITNFSGITEEHDFYVEDNNFVLAFDGYEILKGVSTTHLISIPINFIRSYYVDALETYVTGKYNILMIPLRPICDTYGYDITWFEDINTIVVSNETFNAYMTLDKNLYNISGRSSAITLESPPELWEGGSAYLPISFYEDILGLSYSLDVNGNVTFTSIVPIN